MDGRPGDAVAGNDRHVEQRCRSANLSWRRAGWAVASLLTLAACAGYLKQAVTHPFLDLSVFRDAGLAMVHNQPLYSEQFHSASGFRFIYPPFAAILFAPMAVVAPAVLQIVWSVLNLVLLWWILRIILDRLHVPSPHWAAVAALGPALVLEPIRSNFEFGQINIVLMALVIADCLGALPRGLRGIGIGIAAGVKITPAAFGLVLLLRRDWAGVARALAAFGATVAIGVAARPQESLYFWTTEFFRTDRAGNHDFERNQALSGLLARLGAHGRAEDVLWALGAAAIVAAAVFAGRRFTRAGMHAEATAVVALAALLAAPMAVTHHWTYVVMLVPLAAAPQHRRWIPLLVAAGVVFVLGPNFALTGGYAADADPVLGFVIGNAQAIVAIALLIGAVAAARRIRVEEPEVPSPRGA